MKRKSIFSGILLKEDGQALIIVLVFLVLGTLIIMPVLAHIGTALKTGVNYENKTDRYYAADAGVEDAMWQIKYDRLPVLYGDTDYLYDFTSNCTYQLTDSMNDLTTNVTIQNIWIPSNIAPLDKATGKAVIESGKLVVAGTAIDEDDYRIKIDFYPNYEEGEEDEVLVKSVGVWLPYGFSYVADSSSLATDPGTTGKFTEDITSHAGGEAVVWDFYWDLSSVSDNFTYFPEVELGTYPETAEITFKYTANTTGTAPVTISWIETAGDLSDEIPLSWDVDTRIFHINSAAGDTEVETYAARCELRKMDAAIAGDYKAIGNANLTGTTYRSTWVYEDSVKKSSATLNTIPNGDPEDDIGDVIAAYLYWSGSFKQSPFTSPIWEDSCSNMNNWDGPNKYWDVSNYRFRGQLYSSGTDTRYLEMNNPVDLTGYTPGEVVVEWMQSNGNTDRLESDDGLTFEISNDNGVTWSDPITAFYDYIHLLDYSMAYFYYVLPEEYLTTQFKMRLHLESMTGSSEYVEIDNIALAEIIATPDTNAKFWINDQQVYFLDGEPAQGEEDIVATETWVHAFEKPEEYAYASFLDVTKLVKEYAETVEDEFGVEHFTGNAKYSVGDVDADTSAYRSYAGWSLIIIYSSPETAGHMLYLFDTLALNSGYTDIDFDNDDEPGGIISGFLVPEPIAGETVAATLTCFVGEGDNGWVGDFLAFNTPENYLDNPPSIPDTYKLWDGTSPMNLNNVWNSNSIGMSEPGVDIDTFTIPWSSGMIQADDTEARIDIYTQIDNWMLIYMILSVRSETVTSGTLHYVIHDS